jgi:hypothetical protein
MFTNSLILFLGLLIFGGNPVVQVPSSNADYQYIGAAKCKICHNKEATGAQYAKWETSKHAQAMKSLTGDDAKNPKCLKCHSTYYFVGESQVATLTPEEGVSCETCHGPGSVYKSMSIMSKRETALANGMIMPSEELCKKCHNSESPNFKGFDYKAYLAKIAHPNPNK